MVLACIPAIPQLPSSANGSAIFLPDPMQLLGSCFFFPTRSGGTGLCAVVREANYYPTFDCSESAGDTCTLSVSLSVSVCLCLSVCFCFSVSICMCLSVCVSMSLCL